MDGILIGYHNLFIPCWFLDRPKEMDTSNPRRLCRLLLCIVAISGLTAILTISLLNQPPKRSQRVWLKKEDLNNASRFFDRMALQLNSIEWQCPCKSMDVVTAPKSDARLVEFFLIDVNDPENVIHVNSIEQFCTVVSGIEYFKGFNTTCNKILKESFRLSGWDFMVRSSNLYMNSLKMGSLNPIAFMFDVCNSWAGAKISIWLWDYTSLMHNFFCLLILSLHVM